jgi:hypothetical protein
VLDVGTGAEVRGHLRKRAGHNFTIAEIKKVQGFEGERAKIGCSDTAHGTSHDFSEFGASTKPKPCWAETYTNFLRRQCFEALSAVGSICGLLKECRSTLRVPGE